MPRNPSNTGPVQRPGSGPGRWNGSRPSTKTTTVPPRPRPTSS